MEDSILTSTKQILNISAADTAFDQDILTLINSTLSTVNQLGIGDAATMFVEDNTKTWTQLSLPPEQTHMLKTYVFLQTRIVFDPPPTSFALAALKEQAEEFQWRLSLFREYALEETP